MSNEEPKPLVAAGAAVPVTDRFFGWLAGYLVERIQLFVAFLFMLLGVGVLLGRFIVTQHPQIELFLLAGPFVFALVSYYSRTFAIIAFIALLLVFLL